MDARRFIRHAFCSCSYMKFHAVSDYLRFAVAATFSVTMISACSSEVEDTESSGTSEEGQTAAGCSQLTACIYRKAVEDGQGRNPYEHVTACFWEDIPAPRGIPSAMKVCIYNRGGLGCWPKNWATCPPPVAQNPRQSSCLENRGGLSCFDRR